MTVPARIHLAAPRTAARGPVLWQLGFRPFFLLAALFATAAVPFWLLAFGGRIGLPSESLPAVWHGHEMLFGYTAAVLAGFSLTAVTRWTGRTTATGRRLIALVLLWSAGRVVMWLPGVAPLARLLVDGAFLPALALCIGVPILRARNRRNYVVVAVLLVLAAANLTTHLDAIGLAPGWGRRALLLATQLVVFMMLLIGGRVIPMFTQNALADPNIRSIRWLDRLALGGVVVLAGLEAWRSGGPASSLCAAVSAFAVFGRMRHWGSFDSRREPLLWVLHAGHAWIGVGLVCTALLPFAPELGSSATHAFTAGAIGTLTVGMMARVSLGHTGRLIVSNRLLAAVFLLISAAALVRVVAPLSGFDYLTLLTASGVLWSLSFALFLFDTGPKLLAPRVDGAPA